MAADAAKLAEEEPELLEALMKDGAPAGEDTCLVLYGAII